MMKFNTILSAMALSIGAMTSIPTAGAAQVHGMQSGHPENGRETTALKTRISTVQARVAEGRRSGKVSRMQATRLSRRVSQMQAGMIGLKRKQGFVSAAELASYNRTLGEVDVALDEYGVPRSYGNDGLVAPRAR